VWTTADLEAVAELTVDDQNNRFGVSIRGVSHPLISA